MCVSVCVCVMGVLVVYIWALSFQYVSPFVSNPLSMLEETPAKVLLFLFFLFSSEIGGSIPILALLVAEVIVRILMCI